MNIISSLRRWEFYIVKKVFCIKKRKKVFDFVIETDKKI